MDGWIHSTLPSARTPKIQGVLFVVDSGESGGSLARGRDGRGKLGVKINDEKVQKKLEKASSQL